jgi:uncharacterized protein (DUF1697 family)
MPVLRELLTGAGLEEVRTYVQSGNVVLSSEASERELAAVCERLIADRFGFEVRVVTRTRDELAKIIKRDPLGTVADEPKRYVVHFLSGEPDRAAVDKLAGLAKENEQFTRIGRELYSWHPDGIARSKLAAELARGRSLGATITARNWTTVSQLLAIADE